MLFLYVGDARVGYYDQDLPELDLNEGEAAFPARFIYVTYPLPRSATDGRISVQIRIDAVGGYSMFAAPGSREPPLTQPTRPLYRAYVHADPYFVPPATESQGTKPAAVVRTAPAGYADISRLHSDVDTAVGDALGWQLYGDAWNSAVATGQVPSAVLGLFSAGTTTTRFGTPQAWKDWAVASTTSGFATILNLLTSLAVVFKSSWSQYHGSPDLLARLTRTLDSLALMQGANGAFTSATWVGAPARAVAAGSTGEGSGTRAVGRAFVLVSDALTAAGVLAAPVDDDDDPATPPVPRSQAWADMFVRHRDYLASTAGRAPDTMYDQSQVEALWSANESVRILDPARAWPRNVALETVRTAVGLADGPFGGRSVSPKGLPLEPTGTLDGSYDGRFGILTIRTMCNLASLTGDAAVQGKCQDAVHAAANFIFPSSEAGFRTMRAESAISTVINRNPGFVEYGGNAYAAATLGDATAVRAVQLRLADAAALGTPVIGDVHFAEYLAALVGDLDALESLFALPASPARLPMEEGQPDFVWADEAGGVIAARNCGERLYASLNWRRGFTNGVVDAAHVRVNGIGRIHVTRDRYDRIATIAMDSPQGLGPFYTATFGPYVMGMNLSSDSSYQLSGFAPTSAAFELVRRRPVTSTAAVLVPPGETRLLYRQRPPP